MRRDLLLGPLSDVRMMIVFSSWPVSSRVLTSRPKMSSTSTMPSLKTVRAGDLPAYLSVGIVVEMAAARAVVEEPRLACCPSILLMNFSLYFTSPDRDP